MMRRLWADRGARLTEAARASPTHRGAGLTEAARAATSVPRESKL